MWFRHQKKLHTRASQDEPHSQLGFTVDREGSAYQINDAVYIERSSCTIFGFFNRRKTGKSWLGTAVSVGKNSVSGQDYAVGDEGEHSSIHGENSPSQHSKGNTSSEVLPPRGRSDEKKKQQRSFREKGATLVNNLKLRMSSMIETSPNTVVQQDADLRQQHQQLIEQFKKAVNNDTIRVTHQDDEEVCQG
mmetsp:Transcript_70563/g.146961  ORF Transcript_70563/g.146961 Transcript_70563/m.146961 type:complete len:191 (+) Transcript_70563:249-821(+)|eukprot:CAMPEP_0181316980 /NCGR_PEP_ID=MMETSP1101-20121128/16184_1 /TAXON_ID=46948 /ORGANISM="Rhodomonas abbreviata, Strain Caron Lab Isolate" /LENGTH=190 /DNA_ID=CAMNT_0023424263 /DNA_START=209 /DNA_END=781 /DNA_ORIENTATION=-